MKMMTKMINQFMTTEDNAEIFHSEVKEDGSVYVKRPDIKDCFHHKTCKLSYYSIKEVIGFLEKNIQEVHKQKLYLSNKKAELENKLYLYF